VEDLFTLARADAGQHPLTLSNFYLDELIIECSRSMKTLAAAKQITLTCNASKELPIQADEALLRRMIVNLLDNAIKYTSPSGRVSVSCDAEDLRYVMTGRAFRWTYNRVSSNVSSGQTKCGRVRAATAAVPGWAYPLAYGLCKRMAATSN
jgi:signal transduction histidine kinase